MEQQVASPAKFKIFLRALKAFFAQEFNTRKTKDISCNPSIHPKENVRQLLCAKNLMLVEENGLTYGAYRYAQI
jgi:hypothetical protein